MGRSIESHLTKALERAGLCSNDPVCAQHGTAEDVEERLLHGAACHGCWFIPETSCERRNEHLDRAPVVPTLAHSDVAFFEGARVEAFRRLSAPCLRAVADAVIASRTSHLAEIVEGAAVEPVARDLTRLAGAGVRPGMVAEILRALASERERSQSIVDSLELVSSGEQAVADARHTSVAIQQLFEQAQRSVLIASYALAKGDAAARLFGRLAERMDREPALDVPVFANVERSYSDARSNDVIIRASSTTPAPSSSAPSAPACTRSASWSTRPQRF